MNTHTHKYNIIRASISHIFMSFEFKGAMFITKKKLINLKTKLPV